MLEVLGLRPVEEEVYRRLVSVPSASVDDLAAAMPAHAADLPAAIAALEAHGLVARSTSQPGHVVASPPALALGSMIVQREGEMRRAQLELGRLVEQYRGSVADRAAVDTVEVVRGPQAVAHRFAQIQRGATTEVLALVKSSVALVPIDDNPDEELALRRGVGYRVVLERDAFAKPGFLDAARAAIDLGEQVRVTDALPLRLVVADRSLALVPLAPTASDSGTGALLVHESGLLDALLHLFDLIWAGAHEVMPSRGGAELVGPDRIDDVDAVILGLLLAGLTDQAIGGQVGVSLRTVQRRVAALMERSGAVTRFQLGHEATRRGWVG
ncbi:LuxR family transcriptional regulator [Nocardioides marinquilinus]|uniref:LuxR family transcriptional regulator n=1 Tax=Nocardioides marinquilinus TaxID=1210400 RepID=A0ABP9PEB2_9ACTN